MRDLLIFLEKNFHFIFSLQFLFGFIISSILTFFFFLSFDLFVQFFFFFIDWFGNLNFFINYIYTFFCGSLLVFSGLFFISIPFFRQFILVYYFLFLIYSVYVMFLLNSLFFNFGFFFKVYEFKFINLSVVFTVNFFSMCFIFLTFVLMLICFLVVWNLRFKIREMLLVLNFISFLLVVSFLVDDIVLFYICFEALVMPMFLLIGIWGSRERKIKAAYQFFLYTIFGSLFLLTSIFFIYSGCGTTDVNVYSNCYFSDNRQLICWVLFFIGVSLKVPVIPLHIWLPEAHVEAPTVGSIILAGVLLKLGLFALIKFLYPIFYIGNVFFSIFVFVISGLSVLYASFSTLSQVDMKKLVAYSSVAHMNFCVLGLFTNFHIGWVGSFLVMLSHGFVSSALFLCIGMLYDRYKTRSFIYYGGLVRLMPIFSVFFFLFVLANMAFPGTFNFIAEVLILFGLVGTDLFLGFVSGSSMVFSAAYCLSLYTNLMLLEVNDFFVKYYADVSKREFFMLSVLCFFVFLLGLFPNLVILPVESLAYSYSDFLRIFL